MTPKHLTEMTTLVTQLTTQERRIRAVKRRRCPFCNAVEHFIFRLGWTGNNIGYPRGNLWVCDHCHKKWRVETDITRVVEVRT